MDNDLNSAVCHLLDADVIRFPEKSQVGGTILLNGPSVAVLIIFRVNAEGSSVGSENARVYRPGDPQQPSGPRPREYVLFIKQARSAVGAPEHRGTFFSSLLLLKWGNSLRCIVAIVIVP